LDFTQIQMEYTNYKVDNDKIIIQKQLLNHGIAVT